MDRRGSRDPDPVEIVLVPVGREDGAGLDERSRPPPAGAGTLPPVGALLAAVATRLTAVPDPPLAPDRRRLDPWSDQRVHRLIDLPVWDAAAALDRAAAGWDGRPGPLPTIGPRRRPWRRPPRRARLVLTTPRRRGPTVLAGLLRVRRGRRPTPVMIALVPWSATRCQLVLMPRCRAGAPNRPRAHLPRRYYDAAHVVMDELWHRVERAGHDPTSPPPGRAPTRGRPPPGRRP